LLLDETAQKFLSARTLLCFARFDTARLLVPAIYARLRTQTQPRTSLLTFEEGL